MLIHHNYNYFSIPVFLFHEYLWDGICDCVDGAVSCIEVGPWGWNFDI